MSNKQFTMKYSSYRTYNNTKRGSTRKGDPASGVANCCIAAVALLATGGLGYFIAVPALACAWKNFQPTDK
jgi:hypothetical protein